MTLEDLTKEVRLTPDELEARFPIKADRREAPFEGEIVCWNWRTPSVTIDLHTNQSICVTVISLYYTTGQFNTEGYLRALYTNDLCALEELSRYLQMAGLLGSEEAPALHTPADRLVSFTEASSAKELQKAYAQFLTMKDSHPTAGVCPDCKGTRIYQGLGLPEPCRTCC